MNYNDIISKLTEARREQNLSLRQLSAKSVFFDKTTLSRWERGETQPTMIALRRWANILGYSVEFKLKKVDNGA